MKKLIEIILNKHNEGRQWFAVRACKGDEDYKAGDCCRDSYEWDLEYDRSCYYTTKETAGGTCGVRVDTDRLYWLGYSDGEIENALASSMADALGRAHEYGNRFVLITGSGNVAADYCIDSDREARITDAYVLAVIDDANEILSRFYAETEGRP